MDAFGEPLTAQPIPLMDDWRGLQIRQYVLTIVGPNTSLGSQLADYFDRAYIRAPYDSLPGDVTPFHARFAANVILVGDRLESQIQSGAYFRAENWIYHDSMRPRPYKDLSIDEMRCSLHPAIVRRYGAVPFPCGLREPFNAGFEDLYQATLDFYRNYHKSDDIDFDKCELDYVRPAQTMARLRAGKPAITTFGIVDRTSAPIKRAQLFGPEAA
jgi:hypothetical protein